jgi:hypothetical protein
VSGRFALRGFSGFVLARRRVFRARARATAIGGRRSILPAIGALLLTIRAGVNLYLV